MVVQLIFITVDNSNMEKYLNLLHYCIYKIHLKSHLLMNKINPVRLLAETTIIKERLRKKGIVDFNKDMDNLFGDKSSGVSVTIAGGLLWAVLDIFILSICLVFSLNLSFKLVVSSLVLTGIVCYFLVFKDDKYLDYFDVFERWNKREKAKASIITLLTILSILSLFFVGLLN